jgi:hypothetical protein
MKQSSSEPQRVSASKEIFGLLWNPDITVSHHLSLTLISPIYTLPPYFLETQFNIILHLSLGLPNFLFFSDLSRHVVRISHLPFDLIILTISVEEDKLRNSSVRQFSSASCHLIPNSLLNTLF